MKTLSRKNRIILTAVTAGVMIFAVPLLISKSRGGSFSFSKKQTYYCPMHPTYVSDKPGDCPICNMKLVPKEETGGKKERKILYYRHPMGHPDISPVPKKDSMGMDYIPVYDDELAAKATNVPGHAAVHIPAAKQQLIGVRTGEVQKRRIAKEIRAAGRVVFDPELYTAQQEFISAAESFRKAGAGSYHEPVERAKALFDSARTRLRLLGMSEEEIAELEKQKVQDRNLILPPEAPKEPISLPNQFVWVYGMIYEYEVPFVKIGTPAEVRVPTFPDKVFSGEVRAMDPVLDPMTRTIRVRIRVENPEGILKPEMFADVVLKTDLGEVLSVPGEAVVQTGERAIVFVVQGEGYFEPREVKLGARAGDFYEVRFGLEAGERVAVSGNFLIDSESRLQGALQGMSTEGHQHGT